jgi:hypothetical protein
MTEQEIYRNGHYAIWLYSWNTKVPLMVVDLRITSGYPDWIVKPFVFEAEAKRYIDELLANESTHEP